MYDLVCQADTKPRFHRLPPPSSAVRSSSRTWTRTLSQTRHAARRGTVPSLHTSELKVSVQASVSRGYLAVFSSTNAEDQVGGATGRGGNALGLASGGGGLAWRDGALQDVTFGGTTTLDGDLDLKGHRLLNYNFEVPDIDRVDVSHCLRRCWYDQPQPCLWWIFFILDLPLRHNALESGDKLRQGPQAFETSASRKYDASWQTYGSKQSAGKPYRLKL